MSAGPLEAQPRVPAEGAPSTPRAAPAALGSLDGYLDAAGEASRRSRWSLLVLIVASIFGYASHLSAQAGGWPWRRLDLIESTQRCLAELKDGPIDPAYPACTEDAVRGAGAFLHRWEYSNAKIDSVDALRRLKLGPDILAHHAEHQRDIIMDRIANQTVPVLGFAFDGNDLGKIASLTFLVMLLVLFLALRRERQNVQILRCRAREMTSSAAPSTLSEARDLIYMRQVFSIVSNINQTDTVHEDLLTTSKKKLNRLLFKVMSSLHLLLVWFPILVELQIAYMDFSTAGIGQAQSQQGTLSLFLWERIGGIVSILLAILCNREQLALDHEFSSAKWRPDR